MKPVLFLGPLLLALTTPLPVRDARDDNSPFEAALRTAQDSLAAGRHDAARAWIERALERDAKSPRAWELRARWAAAVSDRDEQVYSLHQELRLRTAQKAPAKDLADLRTRLAALDPIAADLLGLSRVFIAKLEAVARQYEKDRRPHAAIRVHKEILALEPELSASADAIQRLAAAPDPSLAADAKPKDLLAGISEEWIRKHDLEHATWDQRDKLERENYTTYTNAGYAVLLRSAEAMEQMNAFYRQFFRYGTEEDGRKVPRIDLHIFRKREEYLKLGLGPPVEWSGGHFTGSAVETYVGDGTFSDMTNTLFHEAAHQFVSLATSATGWLNEGLASFFEGCRILANGTVLMNLPANHRLFPLVDRMNRGWMTSASDGIDPKDAAASNPERAPTFRIVLENEYAWGPAWYAPTWGVVYFLYNYQDPVDGRFVYRAAFLRFIDKSGRTGKGAVENFEKVVLGEPAPPIKGVPRPKGAADVKLPKTCAELDEVWKEWLVQLRKEQNGEIVVPKPWLQWARYAIANKDHDVAREDFEKGLVATPQDTDLLLEFAAFLAAGKNPDRAAKLALDAVRILEAKEPADEKALRAATRALEKWDPGRRSLETTHRELSAAAKNLVQRYADAHLHLMVMDLALRMTTDLRVPDLLDYYVAAVRQTGKTVALWQLAYNEKNLEGWAVPGDSAFTADGGHIASRFKSYTDSGFDFQVLTLDSVTSGDYSLETEVLAQPGRVNFCGLVFGKKDASNFHGLMLFPGRPRDRSDAAAAQLAASGFIDLASSYGTGSFKTWRHIPVVTAPERDRNMTTTGTWHKLRIDVAGNVVDSWFDGEFLTTQEFPSEAVLRGSFGLITGPGEARFRDVRFMARHPRDPAAPIERQIRMEKLAKSAAGGATTGGSFLGQTPPFPAVTSWVQGARSGWLDKGPVPQLLVLWSIAQNELIPLDPWLRGIAEQNAPFGLELVSVVSPGDAATIADYLRAHAFPGAVAVDRSDGQGLGDTFTAYSVRRFNLPRILLLDVDGKVAWEGDPGFRAGPASAAGTESFLDTPLAELIEKRKLRELAAWRPAWRDKGAPALASGDLAGALALLRQAKGFTPGRYRDVDDARNKLAALENALANLKDTAVLKQDEAEPALPCLVAWAGVLEKTFDRPTKAALQAAAESRSAKDWTAALAHCERVKNRAKPAEKLQAARELLEKLAKSSGRFPRELAADLAPVVEQGDLAALQRLVTEAPERPRLWLVRDYLRW